MAQYRKKPVIVKAHRWFQNGDHPLDEYEKGTPNEGMIVRRYRNPQIDSIDVCKHCNYMMHDHGFIDTLEGGYTVCPGDWIIEAIKGEYYPCKDDIFWETYEPV